MKFGLSSAAVLVALAATASGTAMPADAASLAVGKKAEINVDPKKMSEERAALWARFGGWCAIKDWHPAVASCEESTEGDKQIRTLALKDGGKIKEQLTDRQDNLYRYVILESTLPVQNYEAQFALTPDDDDEDEINFAWSAVFDPKDKPPKEARSTIDGIFRDGLDNIKKLTGGDKDDDKK